MNKIAVLFGGASSEYEVSLLSAASVLQNIDSQKYQITMVGITKAGEWLLYTGNTHDIADGSWCHGTDITPCTLSTSRSFKGLYIFAQDGMKKCPLDCVFPVLHGKNGEDGTIQGLLEIAGLPYVGCNVLASADCMDKEVTHTVLDANQIHTARYAVTTQYEYDQNPNDFLERTARNLHYPLFVKPANAGSSVGISKACTLQEFENACQLAFVHDRKILVEEMITGLEVECSVLGNTDPKASLPGSIRPCNEWYDYDAKYLANRTITDIPAAISADAVEKVRQTAVQAYRALGCTGMARVDFFVTAQEEIILNEINTIPGFTSISMYAKLWAATGISYPQLIDRLITLAMERSAIYG